MPDLPPSLTPQNQLYEYIKIAAQSVNEAANSLQKIKELLREGTPTSEEEGTTTEYVAIEILSDHAMPLPVGSEGTVAILNNSDQFVTMKVGANIPLALPGTVQISIPPGSSAAVQRTRSDAPPLTTQVVSWKRFDPCIPPIPGVICVLPDEWTREEKVKLAGGGDAVGVLIKTGWDSSRTISGDSNGLALS